MHCNGGVDYQYFCAYRGKNYTGTHIAMYTCKVYDIPESWVGPGSWHNNQTPGTVATMYNDAGWPSPGRRRLERRRAEAGPRSTG